MKTTHRQLPVQGDSLGALGRIGRSASQWFAGMINTISFQDDHMDQAILKDVFGRAYLADARLCRVSSDRIPDNSGTHYVW